MLIPIPLNEYKNSIEVKFQAIEHPTADRFNRSNPVKKSDLELNLMLKAPKSSETTKPTNEEMVLICPDIPTCCPNAKPISIKSSIVISPGGCVAKLEVIKDANINLREERYSLFPIIITDLLARVLVHSEDKSYARERLIQLKARSIINNEVIQVEPFRMPNRKLIYLDRETAPKLDKAWLRGLLIGDEFVQLYASDYDDERRTIYRKMISGIFHHP